MKIKNYHPPKKDLWQGRTSISGAEYFHEHVTLIDVENISKDLLVAKSIAIIGFCCDAGVVCNQGRPGAKDSASHNLEFNYFVLGIQETSNIKSLFQTADSLNVNYIKAEELLSNSKKNHEDQLSKFVLQSEDVYLTFCLDVMSQAIAPGVSAPQANGLFMQQVLPLLKIALQQQKLLSFDIVELTPSLDQDNATARLAANIVYEVIKQW